MNRAARVGVVWNDLMRSVRGVAATWLFTLGVRGWIRHDIHEAHQQYLNKHGGHRAKNDDSNHHSINESRLENWHNTWDILGIF